MFVTECNKLLSRESVRLFDLALLMNFWKKNPGMLPVTEFKQNKGEQIVHCYQELCHISHWTLTTEILHPKWQYFLKLHLRDSLSQFSISGETVNVKGKADFLIHDMDFIGREFDRTRNISKEIPQMLRFFAHCSPNWFILLAGRAYPTANSMGKWGQKWTSLETC